VTIKTQSDAHVHEVFPEHVHKDAQVHIFPDELSNLQKISVLPICIVCLRFMVLYCLRLIVLCFRFIILCTYYVCVVYLYVCVAYVLLYWVILL
jgi:hypothetical protein